jgi:putative hydrolase of the HAD superfamily
MKYIYNETGKKFSVNPKYVKSKSKNLRVKWQRSEISSKEFWKQLAAILNISDVKSLENTSNKIFMKYTKPNKKVIEIIKKLKENNFKVVALSNTVEPHVMFHKKKGHYKIFDKAFLSNELGMRKPELRIFEYVLDKMNVKANECVFIDDKKINLIAAKILGMKTIFFKNSEMLKKDLKKLL